MEDKILKIPVFTNECICQDSVEIPIDIDFSLPDYCPEIIKILKCKAISRISSKNLSAGTINIEGGIFINIIYSSNDSRICAYEYNYPFSKKIEISKEYDNGELICKTKCEYVNCRVVTSRKLDIHGAAGLYFRIQRRKNSQIIADVDDNNIEVLRAVTPATTPMGYCDKYLEIEEEIELGPSQPAVSSILRYDSDNIIKECKLMQNKLMLKGETAVSILYLSVNDTTESVHSVIPFSQIVEIDGISESCECAAKAETAFIELKPRVGVSGEAKSFSLNAKILTSCDCYCNKEIDYVVDAYSRKNESNTVKGDLIINKIHSIISDTFSCKKEIELSDSNILGIEDMWFDIKNDSPQNFESELIFKGEVVIGIIVRESNGELSYCEKSVEFEYRYNLDFDAKKVFCEPNIDVGSSNYTLLNNGKMELRIELTINSAVYNTIDLHPVCEINVDEGKTIEKNRIGALTIYFADKGEHLWDIARKYLAPIDEIKQINDICADTLENSRMVLIPLL